MRLNTVIKLPDGRVGTICYHNLNGDGGVFGRHTFEMPDSGFSDDLPVPQFMLRDKRFEAGMRADMPGVECVGDEYDILEFLDDEDGVEVPEAEVRSTPDPKEIRGVRLAIGFVIFALVATAVCLVISIVKGIGNPVHQFVTLGLMVSAIFLLWQIRQQSRVVRSLS